MALPIREEILESTREVRVNGVGFDTDKDDRIIYADIDFELRHRDQYGTVDKCWVLVEINRAQKEQLAKISKDWQERKVHIRAVATKAGSVSLCVTMVQLVDTWIEPVKVIKPSRELSR